VVLIVIYKASVGKKSARRLYCINFFGYAFYLQPVISQVCSWARQATFVLSNQFISCAPSLVSQTKVATIIASQPQLGVEQSSLTSLEVEKSLSSALEQVNLSAQSSHVNQVSSSTPQYGSDLKIQSVLGAWPIPESARFFDSREAHSKTNFVRTTPFLPMSNATRYFG
jgi:hypothetical protein